MKEETKFLIEIADRFDDDAQDVLDFVAKNGNLEKAAKALAGAGMPTAAPVPTIACPERSDLDKLPDGVYFITGTLDGESNTKTYVKYDPSMTAAPFPTKYIGVKLGHHTVAVALEDLPGDSDGELQLLPRDHTSPETSEHYSWMTRPTSIALMPSRISTAKATPSDSRNTEAKSMSRRANGSPAWASSAS